MGKGIFFGTPTLYGHTNPTLPLVAELVTRGEQIIYYSDDSFARRIEASGAEYRSSGDLADLARRVVATVNLHHAPAVVLEGAKHFLERESSRIERDAPDYIVYDFIALWGRYLGIILQMPAIASIPTFAMDDKVMRMAFEATGRRPGAGESLKWARSLAQAAWLGRTIERRYGITKEDAAAFDDQVLHIVFTSEEFQPYRERFGPQYKFVGASIDERDSGGSGFPWERLTHPNLIYVSMGTLFNADRSFFETCFAALGPMDCQVVLSTGNGVSARELGGAPPNFIVCNFVPQAALLKRARLMINNAGMNTVAGALLNGVPMLVVPQMFENALNAARIVQIGAGMRLYSRQVTAPAMRSAVEELLRDGSYRELAARMGETLRTAGGPSRAAGEILSHARAGVTVATSRAR